METVERQKYECAKCGLRGSVFFTEKDNVLSMCIKIAADHHIHSPGCEDWEGNIRLWIEKGESYYYGTESESAEADQG